MTPARLSSSRDIRAVFASGRSVASRSSVVALRDRNDEAAPRVAVVAGRKVGTAVDRNRAKRRLRAAAREVNWPIGTDVVLTARQRALSARFDELVGDVATSLVRASRQVRR